MQLDAMDTLVRRGRVRGLGCTLITQRPAVLSKNVLSQAEILIAMRMTAQLDRKAIDAWVSAHGTEEERREVMGSLATLGIGEGWVWAPNLVGDLKRVQIRRRRTFDASATPKVGETVRAPKALADINLSALSERFAAQVQSAQEADPEALRTRIRELERALAERPADVKTVEKIVEKRVEVPVPYPVLAEGDLERLLAVRDAMTGTAKDLMSAAAEISARLSLLTGLTGSHSPGDAEAASPVVADSCSNSHSFELKQPPAPATPTTPTTPIATGSRTNSRKSELKTAPGTADGWTPSKGERRILEALARYPAQRLTTAQLGTLTKLTTSGGTWSKYMATLRGRSLIRTDGDGMLQITEAGMSILGAAIPPAPQTAEEILQLWAPALRSKELDMLRHLVGLRPRAITLDALATQFSLTRSGGTFSSYVGTLTRNRLAVVENGRIRASETIPT